MRRPFVLPFVFFRGRVDRLVHEGCWVRFVGIQTWFAAEIWFIPDIDIAQMSVEWTNFSSLQKSLNVRKGGISCSMSIMLGAD